MLVALSMQDIDQRDRCQYINSFRKWAKSKIVIYCCSSCCTVDCGIRLGQPTCPIKYNEMIFFRTNQTHNRFLLVKTTMNDRYADWHIQVDAFKFCLNMQINARSSSLMLHTHKNAAAIRQFIISLLLFCHWSLGNRLILPFFFLCSPMNGHNTTHNYYQSCIDCLNHLINYSHWDIKLKWAEKKWYEMIIKCIIMQPQSLCDLLMRCIFTACFAVGHKGDDSTAASVECPILFYSNMGIQKNIPIFSLA